MKCTRCYKIAEAIMCSNCYAENCKHNEQGRRLIMQKYQSVANTFQNLVSQNLYLGNNLTIINRKAAMIHSHKDADQLLQSKYDLLERKRKENEFLKQKIANRKAYIVKLQHQTKQVEGKVNQKLNQIYIISSKTQKICLEVKQILHAKFRHLIRYIKDDFLKSSKETWNKFVNMEQQFFSMYISMMQHGMQHDIVSQISKIHGQIKKQMVLLGLISNLLQVSLPYPIDLQNLLNINADSIIFLETNQGKMLNKPLLRKFQVNTNYLFSRLGIQMQYPQINCQSLSSLLSAFIQKRLKIVEWDKFDYTQPIYFSSLQMVQGIFSKPIILSESIPVTMDAFLFELTAQGLLNHHKSKNKPASKMLLEEESTNEIEFTGIIDLTAFRSIDSSDEQMEILQ